MDPSELQQEQQFAKILGIDDSERFLSDNARFLGDPNLSPLECDIETCKTGNKLEDTLAGSRDKSPKALGDVVSRSKGQELTPVGMRERRSEARGDNIGRKDDIGKYEKPVKPTQTSGGSGKDKNGGKDVSTSKSESLSRITSSNAESLRGACQVEKQLILSISFIFCVFPGICLFHQQK